MFSRIAAAMIIALPVLASATGTGGDMCSTGPVQCCDHVEKSDSAVGSAILAGLGLNVQDVTGAIGLDCSPLSVIGVGNGGACSSNAVCCQNNNVGGLISVGCIPVSL